MTLLDLFEKVAKELHREEILFALAGGLAASAYRQQKRTTDDLDYVVAIEPDSFSKLHRILEKFHLKGAWAREADLRGGPLFAIKKKNTPEWILVGRDPKDRTKVGIDFILTRIPWAPLALQRAKNNQIDFGFGPIPCITPEDLILSKLFALDLNGRRFSDLDDLQDIFRSRQGLNLEYLAGQMANLRLPLPPSIVEDAPVTLQILSKKIRRSPPLKNKKARI